MRRPSARSTIARRAPDRHGAGRAGAEARMVDGAVHAACVQAPSERGAGRDADDRGSPRLPNSPEHRALQSHTTVKEVAREAIGTQEGPRLSGALRRLARPRPGTVVGRRTPR